MNDLTVEDQRGEDSMVVDLMIKNTTMDIPVLDSDTLYLPGFNNKMAYRDQIFKLAIVGDMSWFYLYGDRCYIWRTIVFVSRSNLC